MMVIDRTQLLQELFEFSQQGSGMIVGKPGAGKSYILKQLKDRYLERNDLAVMIKIDNLTDASNESIETELGINTPWIETFQKIKLKDNKKALLIFDAFDAARNEVFRNNILKQMKFAKERLSEKWNILVSVRTYDAVKSQQLIQLFPLSEDNSDNIHCRKKYVPVLEPNEVEIAVASNKKLEDFYVTSTAALREILRIPFFLNLSDIILHGASDEEVSEIKKFKSETQLLKTFWDRKIINVSNHILKEKILIQLTKLLVESKSLSCAKQTFVQGFSSEDSESFDYLRSENILDEVSINGSRIAYAHNILFDFAVSILYITNEITEVLSFIKQDASRPFFLRPSFIYFFTQLWYEQRQTFWQFFWAFSKENTKELQLFQRLVLTGVISSEYNALRDLEPITTLFETKKRNEIIRNLLQSIRFIRKRTITQDIFFLEYLSTRLDPLFIWDFAFLLDRAINEQNRIDDLINNCGIAARNFLSFVLEKRSTDIKPIIDRLGATRGVELVCKTYKTDISASKALLQSLFELLKENDFEIYYFTNLSEYIKDILNYDPQFVGEVYLRLFDHTETSDAQTSMGTSVVMSFTSNRRQDFEMCHYRLTEFYPQFLSASPIDAIPIGLKVVNDFVTKDRQRFYASELEEEQFVFKSFECTFIRDLSSIWSDNLTYHRYALIAKHIIQYFSSALRIANSNLRDYLNLYVQFAKTGYTWKLLIEFGVQAVKEMSDYFFDFCLEEIFLTNSDTSYEIGQLIEKGSEYFNEDQLKSIEEGILDISEKAEINDSAFFKRKYLSRIPKVKLTRDESKKIIEESGVLANQKPYESTTQVGTYTTEMWLQDQGVDVMDPTTADLLKQSSELRPFNGQWLNGKPNKEDFQLASDKASALFTRLIQLEQQLHKDVVFSVLSEIAQTFTIISRSIEVLNDEEFNAVKRIVLYCYNYVSEIDKTVDENASPSSGYSPTPRIIASEGLAQITSRDDSRENIETLIAATNDPNAIIRFHAVRYIDLIEKKQPSKYLEIIYQRLELENDSFVASMVIGNVRFPKYDEQIANKVLTIAYNNEKLFKWHNSFVDNFVALAIWLYTTHKNDLANNLISRAYEREELCRTVIFKAFDDFRIVSLKHYSNSDFIIDSCIKWSLTYLHEIDIKLKAITQEEFKVDNPDVKSCLGLIHLIIERSYFALERTGKFKNSFQVPDESRSYLYFKIKPIFEKIILISSDIVSGGLIAGHTAHYFIQTLNATLEFDPRAILSMVTKITKYSLQTGYTFDSMAIREVVTLTEKLLADYRQLLTEEESFNNLIDLLDIYMQSGWVDALDLLWKLDEIFK